MRRKSSDSDSFDNEPSGGTGIRHIQGGGGFSLAQDSIIQPYTGKNQRYKAQTTKVVVDQIETNQMDDGDVIKKVPGIEQIMEKLGKTICDSDEISIP